MLIVAPPSDILKKALNLNLKIQEKKTVFYMTVTENPPNLQKTPKS